MQGRVVTDSTSCLPTQLTSQHNIGVVWQHCDFPGCEYKTKHKGSLKNHKAARHNIGVVWQHCGFPGCEYKTKHKSTLRRHKAAQHNIGVSAICPGVINTPIVRASEMHGPENRKLLQAEGIRAFEQRNYPPHRVAKGILSAIQKNKRLAPVAIEARIGYWVKRFFPGWVAWFAERQASSLESRIEKLGS